MGAQCAQSWGIRCGPSEVTEPTSLGERRALDGDSGAWTPREMLAYMLRQIESGNFSPDGMVVCWFKDVGNGTITGMRRSKTTVMEAVSMIEIAKYDLLHIE